MRIYLDTSALAKRYVTEEGSSEVDSIFGGAADGTDFIIVSYWNIGETAVVFDKFARRTAEQSSTKLMGWMLDEFQEMGRLQALSIIEVGHALMQDAIGFVFKHHIYIADALQVATAKAEFADLFVSGDKKLVNVAAKEGLETRLV